MAELKKVVTPVFRVSFPSLFQADSYDGGEAKFGLTAIWDPSKFSAQDKRRWKAVMALLDEASKAEHRKSWKNLPVNFKRGVRDGAEKADLEGYGEGKRFANITSKMRPGVIDLDDEEIGPEHNNADRIYPGCYARATVTAYGYSKKGKGVSLGLQNVQFVKDGDRLDSRTNASEDFQNEEIDDQWLDDATDDDDDEIPF